MVDAKLPPRASVPSSSVDAEQTINQMGFKVITRKLPILKAAPIEEMTQKLGIAPPEMIFGDNLISIEHASSGWSISFDAFGALDRVDKTGETMLKVSYSKEWQKNRQHVHEDIKEVVKPFDWSYSTDYTGTVNAQSDSPSFTPTTKPIPVALLTQPDPILFFDEVMLYEDELADNGIALLSCKVRVMPARMLLLCRFFLRLDGVIFRIRDTRVYIEFASGEVIREYTAREDDYEAVRHKLASTREDVPAMMRDANRLTEVLPIKEQRRESLVLSKR